MLLVLLPIVGCNRVPVEASCPPPAADLVEFVVDSPAQGTEVTGAFTLRGTLVRAGSTAVRQVIVQGMPATDVVTNFGAWSVDVEASTALASADADGLFQVRATVTDACGYSYDLACPEDSTDSAGEPDSGAAAAAGRVVVPFCHAFTVR